MTLRSLLFASALFVTPIAASAQAPTPASEACGTFAWPVETMRQALAGNVAKIASGAMAPRDFELALMPTEQVAFPTKPERTPKKPNTFGGYVSYKPADGKTLQVTLSDEAWIDVVQSGAPVKSAAFSGKSGCEGIRKSVRFTLPATEPVTSQISGAPSASIRIDLRSVE